MNFCKTLIAASLAAFPMTIVGVASAAPMALAPQQNDAILAKLASQGSKSGLDADHGLVISNQHPGVSGTLITRLNHTYKGVRVFGSESVIVSDGAGAIVSESTTERRQGLGRGTANKLGAATVDFNVTPTISAKAATNTAVKSRAANGVHLSPPLVELIIYPIIDSVRVAGAVNKAEADLNALDMEDVVVGYKLAYLVQTRMADGSRPIFHDSIIDAHDGSILSQWSALQTVVGTGNS